MRARYTVALASAVSIVAFWAAAQAAEPTQSDFDTCNREAQARASSPAASPSGSGSGTGTSTGTSASGGMQAGGSSSTAAPGTSSGSPSTSGASRPSGSGSASDPALRGIAQAGQNDPAYQQAYRDCLKRRGF